MFLKFNLSIIWTIVSKKTSLSSKVLLPMTTIFAWMSKKLTIDRICSLCHSFVKLCDNIKARSSYSPLCILWFSYAPMFSIKPSGETITSSDWSYIPFFNCSQKCRFVIERVVFFFFKQTFLITFRGLSFFSRLESQVSCFSIIKLHQNGSLVFP